MALKVSAYVEVMYVCILLEEKQSQNVLPNLLSFFDTPLFSGVGLLREFELCFSSLLLPLSGGGRAGCKKRRQAGGCGGRRTCVQSACVLFSYSFFCAVVLAQSKIDAGARERTRTRTRRREDEDGWCKTREGTPPPLPFAPFLLLAALQRLIPPPTLVCPSAHHSH